MQSGEGITTVGMERAVMITMTSVLSETTEIKTKRLKKKKLNDLRSYELRAMSQETRGS